MKTMAEVSTKVPSFLLLFSMVASFRVGEPVPAPAQKRVLGARRGGGGHTERELRPSPPPPPPLPLLELSAGTEMQLSLLVPRRLATSLSAPQRLPLSSSWGPS